MTDILRLVEMKKSSLTRVIIALFLEEFHVLTIGSLSVFTIICMFIKSWLHVAMATRTEKSSQY